MSDTKNIYQLLHEARQIVSKAGVKKDGRNQMFSYFTPENIKKLAEDACEKTGTIYLTSLKQDEFGYYQILNFIDLKAPQDDPLSFELRTEKPEIKTSAAQQMGAMDTYSERYILMKVFQIKDNNMDPDSRDSQPASTEVAREPVNEQHMNCPKCGEPMVERSGEKNGKHWAGMFCSDKTHPPKWL